MLLMNVAVYVAIIESEDFKKYLFVCEYLQIDPSQRYDKDFIVQRTDNVLSQWSDQEDGKQYKKLERSLKWFNKRYKKLVGSRILFDYNFPKRCTKLIAKGQLVLQEGTVNEEYQKRDLETTNYDHLRWYCK